MMATCRNCGVSSREDPTAMRVELVLDADPIGTFSVAGATMKVTVKESLRLRCLRCGWSIGGYYDCVEQCFTGIPETERLDGPTES